uniref:DnaJ-like protein C11 C-terminal domain-containing protein n=1 Tax=viral metagenome TaxID=1070528 RepID=A0A6C0KE51_9ZZZZ
MSTGISIKTAIYGVGSTTIDVVSAVTSQNKDGTINFAVSPAALNVDDPAPGQTKTLNVTYTINGGSTNTASVKDGNTFHIEAPPARTASGLQITKAEYGYQGNYTDVTNAVQDKVSNGSINLKVGYAQVGIPDPNPNKQKDLKVEYTINGASSSQIITDGQTFSLSAPPLADSTSSTSSGTAFIGSVWSAVWLFIKVFYFVSMILLAWNVGNQWNQGAAVVVALMTFITYGLFPIIIMPIVIFWWRLCVNHEVIVLT